MPLEYNNERPLNRTTIAPAPEGPHLPQTGGTYLLLMRSEAPSTVTLGRFGTVPLHTGWYLYAGSALGPGGLRGRLGHHLRTTDRPHWHIDYLRQHLPLTALWWLAEPARQECLWSELLQQWRGAVQPWPGFGASDCHCTSHLTRLGYCPSRRTFQQRLREVLGRAVRVKEFRRTGKEPG